LEVLLGVVVCKQTLPCQQPNSRKKKREAPNSQSTTLTCTAVSTATSIGISASPHWTNPSGGKKTFNNPGPVLTCGEPVMLGTAALDADAEADVEAPEVGCAREVLGAAEERDEDEEDVEEEACCLATSWGCPSRSRCCCCCLMRFILPKDLLAAASALSLE
jgi:hypothetical protein